MDIRMLINNIIAESGGENNTNLEKVLREQLSSNGQASLKAEIVAMQANAISLYVKNIVIRAKVMENVDLQVGQLIELLMDDNTAPKLSENTNYTNPSAAVTVSEYEELPEQAVITKNSTADIKTSNGNKLILTGKDAVSDSQFKLIVETVKSDVRFFSSGNLVSSSPDDSSELNPELVKANNRFTAQVVGEKSDKIVLQTGNSTFNIKTDQVMEKGDTVSLIVKKVLPDKIIFEISPKIQIKTEGFLKENNITVNQYTTKFTEALINSKLPLDVSKIENFNKKVQTLVDEGLPIADDDIDVLVKMYNKDLPITKETFVFIKPFIKNYETLGPEIMKLMSEFNKIKAVPDDFVDSLKLDYQILEKIFPDNSLSDIMIKQFNKGMKLFIDNFFLHSQNIDSENPEGILLKDFLKTLLDDKINKNIAVSTMLADNQKADENVSETVSKAAGMILSSHALAKGMDENNNSFLMFSVPFSFNGQVFNNSIRISYNKKDSKSPIQWQNCSININVETISFGKLQIALKFKNAILDCDIKSDNEPSVVFINENISFLSESLQKAGFNTGKIECNLLKQPIKEDSLPKIRDVSFQKIDIIV